MEINLNDEKLQTESIVKITITKEAGDVLADLVEKANEGFAAGRINRQDLASFIFEKCKTLITDKELNQIRKQHYDESAMLEAEYRKMKETGKVSEFLQDALRKQFEDVNLSFKKSKKSILKEKKIHSVKRVNDKDIALNELNLKSKV